MPGSRLRGWLLYNVTEDRVTTDKAKTGVVVVGCGGMARHHLLGMIEKNQARVEAVVDPSQDAIDAINDLFTETNVRTPTAHSSLAEFFASDPATTGVALIASPHAFHHAQTVECLEQGLDVLLEKPMVTTENEALDLIRVRDETGSLLVVAFPGSLSPAIREASRMIRDGDIGELISISATVWQNWATNTANTWRQRFELSGGGFLFDTGAHMLNTVVDLAGQDFVEVAAMTRSGVPGIEYTGTIIGRLESGALVTMHGCGETIESCESEVRVFGTRKFLRTGVWGKTLEIQTDGVAETTTFQKRKPTDVWEQFELVRNGSIENPCPPEIGLRMARLWDAIRESSARGGQPVPLADLT